MIKKAMLPIGIDNFGELITHKDSSGTSYLFIDKSLFIHSFIDSGDKITLITRPRRFGKTLALSMLQHFLAAEVSGQQTQGLFDELKISQHPEIMAMQGKYPVIFLTLKSIKGATFDEFFAEMQSVFWELYREHRYLLNEKHSMSADDAALFTRFLNKKATLMECTTALRFLCTLLCQHNGKKVIILLDEYDTPLNHAFTYDHYEQCRNFLASLFGSTFKGNDALHKGLITGILKIAKASLFSELNNVKVYSILDDDRYASYFGFTVKETDNLLNQAQLPQQAYELKEMYDGYTVSGVKLYNPFSIVSFVSKAVLIRPERIKEACKPYWINTGGTHLIGHLIEKNIPLFQPSLNKLFQDQPIWIPFDEEVVFGDYLKDNEASFWSLLLLSGYLKVVDQEEEMYALIFPNEEVKKSMRLLCLRVATNYRALPIRTALQSLVGGDIPAFTHFLCNYLKKTSSFRDTKGIHKEQFYHGLVLGMSVVISNTHYITSNRISGKGIYDIAIEPKDLTQLGFIIELKVADQEDDLCILAKEAKKQAIERVYARDMQTRGIEKICCLGVAFHEDEVVVEA